MNKTLAALVLGAGILGAGCKEFKHETGQVVNFDNVVYKAGEVNGWKYVHWEDGIYGKNPQTCEQLSMPGKSTVLFPVYGVKDGNVVSGKMCCLGFKSDDGDFWAEYCMLLEDKAEMPLGGQ